MTDRPIPFVDLSWQHNLVADDVGAGFERVFAKTSFILGPEAEAFEAAYAAYTGVEHCVGVGSGTDAIELALRALDIGPGDEVITAANTFVATAEAIVRAGARLVLVDCGPDYLLDIDRALAAVTRRTKAVVPVHLYGQLANVDGLRAALPARIAVVEDAAQSQGAAWAGRRSGSLGSVAATSFYPGKNLGAYGDAGGVTTDDAEIASRLRSLRNHGGQRKYEHGMFGVNSRLDGLQAVVLAAKLRYLDGWNELRRAAADHYGELLGGHEKIVLPTAAEREAHVWHLYVVRVPRRDDVLAELNAAGIGAGIHYPAPIHLLPPFAEAGELGAFPVAEQAADEILSLPIYPGITGDQQERVADALVKAIA